MSDESPKIGILLIATNRFRNMGDGLPEGSYHERKIHESTAYLKKFSETMQIVDPGIIYTREELIAAMATFAASCVDCVFTLFLSWSEDFVWVRFLRDMPPLPIFFGCVVRDKICFANTTKESDFVEFLSAGGLVGALEASGSVARFARPMLHTAIGTLQELHPQLTAFARAAAVRSKLRRSVFGLLASYNEVMWSTYVDPYSFFAKAGPELRFLSVVALLRKIEETPQADVDAAMAALRAQYKVMPDVDTDKFAASVRASLALEALAREQGVEMVVLNDVDPILLSEVGLRPGFLPCPGTTDIGVVPEGDLGGGLATYLLGQLSGKPVNFIEPFHIDRPGNCFAAGHAGPNNYTDPAGKVVIGRDVRFAKTAYKHAGAPFAWYVIPPGRKTMLHLSQQGDSFKMVCTLVDALPCEHFITSYSHGLLRPVGQSCTQLFGKLLQLGVTQHYALAEGDHIQELRLLAELMSFSFTEISE